MQCTPLIGAVLIVDALQKLRGDGTKKKRVRATGNVFVLVIIGATFLPSPNSWRIGSTIARLPTLGVIPAVNTEAPYNGLAEFIRSYDGPKQVLTDPVTGYVLRGMTGAQIFTDKFQWHPQPEHSLVRKHYSPYSFDEHNGWLLVINLTSNRFSKNGQIAGHWSADVLNTKSFYPEQFLDWIDRKEELLRLNGLKSGETKITPVWKTKGTSVYEISIN